VDYGHGESKHLYGTDPRTYCILSKEFVGDENGNVTGINTIRVEWTKVSNLFLYLLSFIFILFFVTYISIDFMSLTNRIQQAGSK
jgi:hypothetical protein